MSEPFRNPLIDGFFRAGLDRPDEPAIWDERGRTTSFAELEADVEHFRSLFARQGLQRGDRVLILGLPNRELFGTVLAILRLGGSLVLADPGMGRDVFRSRVKMAQPRWAYLGQPLRSLMPHPILRWLLNRRGRFVPGPADLAGALSLVIRPRVSSGTIQQTRDRSGTILRQTVMPGEHEQVIVFTSGTTAEPKGVVHTVGSLLASLRAINSFADFSPASRIYTSLPYFLLIGLASGVAVQVSPVRFSASRWHRAIVQRRPTHIFAAPSELDAVAREFLRSGERMPESLINVMLGSAPVTRPVLERVIAVLPTTTHVLGVYGLTEMLPVAIVDGRVKLKREVAGDWLGGILPEITPQVSADGELLVSAPHMSPQYLGQAPTASVATGDIVTMQGRDLVLRGRKKDMIIRGNYNIYPRLYEPTIERIPGVAACAMVGVWDAARNDEHVVLVVEPGPEFRGDLAAIVRKSIAQPQYSIDQAAQPDIVLSMTLPRSGRQSKIDKAKLRELISRRV